MVRFWDNSEEYHGSLLWEGADPKDWSSWQDWLSIVDQWAEASKKEKKKIERSVLWLTSLEWSKG